MPIFRGIEEGRADKNYNSPEMDDIWSNSIVKVIENKPSEPKNGI
jgi:hypothetical protein